MNNYPVWGNPYPYNPQMNMQMNQQNMNAPQIQRTSVKTVTGRDGASAYPLAPESSELLLDESSPIVWLVKTDSAGFKTITPYSITPYEEKPPIDVSSFEERLKRLEEQVNAKPDNASTRSKKSE